jgi:hypothetical protein
MKSLVVDNQPAFAHLTIRYVEGPAAVVGIRKPYYSLIAATALANFISMNL